MIAGTKCMEIDQKLGRKQKTFQRHM